MVRELGPYRILRQLGRGGMGLVYLGVHRETGAEVAVKTVPSDGDADVLAGIRREIHALACLHHPGIVAILGHGSSEGAPWYAMSLVRGPTLARLARLRSEEGWGATSELDGGGHWTEALAGPSGSRAAAAVEVERPGGGPEGGPGSLPRLLTIVRRLCAPLAYLHGEGIVHRDLKPGNVIIAEGDAPVLVDFGLAGQFSARISRERLRLDEVAAGTIAYLAPEQGDGALVDARADLYALGCILYELVTGRLPFEGSTPYDMLRARYARDPEPPSSVAGGVSPELDSLVMRLLAREPGRRLGHAEDVSRILGQLGAADVDGGGPRPRPYLYQPGFRGRDAELESLLEPLDDLGRGRGGLVLLGGESGIGKTRLAMALAGRALERGMSVLIGECVFPKDQAGQRALEAIARPLQEIADKARAGGADEIERVFGPRLPVLAQYQPSLGDLCPGGPAEPAPMPPRAARLRLFRFLAETLEAFSRRGPVVAILDDVQWADELTLGFLRYLADRDRISGMGVLVVGTYRSDESRPELDVLRSLPGVNDRRIGALDADAVGQMAAEMLALEEAPHGFAAFLARVSEGNPFFAGEYLRTAVAEGLLDRDAAGVWRVRGGGAAATSLESLSLPTTIHEMISRRLDALPGVAGSVLDALAVLRRPAPLLLLGEASALEEGPLNEGLTALLARQVVEQGAGGEVRFLHGKIRDVAYGRMEPGARAERHRLAAAAIEKTGLDRDADLAELGHHHERAGNRAAARACYLPAARSAAARAALQQAEELYLAYLAVTDGVDGERVRARVELGQKVLLSVGRMEEARATHERALEEARGIQGKDVEAFAVSALAFDELQMGRLPEAEARYVEAIALYRSLGDVKEEARNAGELAAALVPLGRTEEARRLFEAALACHRESGNLNQEAMVTGNLATLEHQSGRTDAARDLYARALHLHRQHGNLLAEAHVLGNTAWLHHEHGDLDRSRALYAEALALSVRIGHRPGEGAVRANLGLWYEDQRMLSEAEEEYGQALLIAKEVGDRRLIAHVSTSLASVASARGRWSDATSLLADAMEIVRGAGDRRAEGVVLHLAALNEQAAGRPTEGLAVMEQAERVARDVGDRRFTTLARLGRADILMDMGRHAEARTVLGEATWKGDMGTELRVRALATDARLHAEAGAVAQARSLYQQASEGRRERASRVDIEVVMGQATLARRTGDLALAGELLERAEVASGGISVLTLLCRLQKGHLALASGNDAARILGEVEREILALEAPPESVLGRSWARLDRACRASRNGRLLVAGEAAEDAPVAFSHGR